MLSARSACTLYDIEIVTIIAIRKLNTRFIISPPISVWCMLRLPLPLFSKTAAGAKMIQLFRFLHTFWTDGLLDSVRRAGYHDE
jgi:hypothetical protein